jgi:hypothetical protein
MKEIERSRRRNGFGANSNGSSDREKRKHENRREMFVLSESGVKIDESEC